jgi:hypothetical protein
MILPVAAALALPALAAAVDRVISRDRTAANLSAFGQGLVWSRTETDGRARLVLRGFGAPGDVNVAPLAGGLFDPDLGEDASGGVVAVYTRCAGVSGRNCDVYEFDFARDRERKVPGASSPRCSEFAPSIWQGAIAFARSGPKGCGGLYVKGRRGSPLQLDSRVPADTDFRAGRVAYLLTPAAGRSMIRVFTIKEGSSRAVVSGLQSQGERTRVSSPIFGGRYIYFLFQDQRRKRFAVGRSRGHGNSSVQFSDRSLPGAVDSIAVDGRKLYYANGRGVFEATNPIPRFSAKDI